MSDLRDLPELARDVRERVVSPPYDEVSRRVRAPDGSAVPQAASRRRSLSSAASPSGMTWPRRPAHPSRSRPTRPRSRMTDEWMRRGVVDSPDAHVFQASGADDGSVAVIWRALEQPAPTWALVIEEADGTLHGIRLDDFVVLTPVPGGWVGLDTARGYFIGTDGSWKDLGRPGNHRRAHSPETC